MKPALLLQQYPPVVKVYSVARLAELGPGTNPDRPGQLAACPASTDRHRSTICAVSKSPLRARRAAVGIRSGSIVGGLTGSAGTFSDGTCRLLAFCFS